MEITKSNCLIEFATDVFQLLNLLQSLNTSGFDPTDLMPQLYRNKFI